MMDMRSQETLLAEIGDSVNMLDDQAFAMLVMEWQSESAERRALLLQILAAVGIETIRPIANKLAGLAS